MKPKMACVLVFWFSSLCAGDVKYSVVTHGSLPDHQETRYVKGQRVRVEFPDHRIVSIKQCDLSRTILIDPTNQTFNIQPIQPQSPAPEPRFEKQRLNCGGIVHVRHEVIETNEHQEMFGLDARRIVTRIHLEPEGGACMRGSLDEQETEGWYVEMPPEPQCTARVVPSHSGPDEFIDEGETVSPNLFPLKLTTKIPLRNGDRIEWTVKNTLEVTDFSTAKLDDSLFDLPSAYKAKADAACEGRAPETFTEADGTQVYKVGCSVKPPVIVHHIDPEYTDSARKAKVSGTVILSLIVNSDGSVRNVQVERSLRSDLDGQALAAVRGWRFDPATKDGIAVPVKLNVEVTFRLY